MSSICRLPQYPIATLRSMSSADCPRYQISANSTRSNTKKGPTPITRVQWSRAASRSVTTNAFCMTGPKIRRISLVQARDPADSPRQNFVVHGRLPTAPLHVGIILHVGLHVESTAAMAQRAIQNLAMPVAVQIQHRPRLIGKPFALGKAALRLPVEMGM